jgi:DNA primase
VASFSVNTAHNIWYDFGEGRGGDGIDFIQAYYNLTDVSAALAQLQRLMEQAPVHPKPLPRPFAKPQSSPLEVRHIGALKNRALIRYLKQRGISVKTATPYLKEIYYARGSNNYFALAFANESGGYEMRNPYFKGVYGTKAISVIGKRDLRSKKK